MNVQLDETHDPKMRSWVESANIPESDFPIQNLPFGVFRRLGTTDPPSVGVAIGDSILDIGEARRAGLFESDLAEAVDACRRPELNRLMSLEPSHCSRLRRRLSRILDSQSSAVAGDQALREKLLLAQDEAEMFLPTRCGDYTDFYASIFHATNVGSLFRPDNPLLPNYKYIPIGYHGRSSSLVVSQTPVTRPSGQTKGPGDTAPVYGPCRLLDYELEVGFFVGPGNSLGTTIPIEEAESHIFGFCLVNDWSARDIQAWEYQPLGPFLGKSFATSLSPWVVTLEALAPFRSPPFERPQGDPAPLPYLVSGSGTLGVDIQLEVLISTTKMQRGNDASHRLSRSNFASMYWTPAQMLTHHAGNGCNLRPGDLMASGTVSGPQAGSGGCLLELTWRGSKPIALPNGEVRRFLEDGDEVTIRGRCQRAGYTSIGFGVCKGKIQSTEAATVPEKS